MLPILKQKAFRLVPKTQGSRAYRYTTGRKTLEDIIISKEASTKTANLGKVKLDGTTGRFYKDVSVVKVGNHYEIEFDGYAMLSRGEKRIQFPNAEIALAVASDWDFFHKRIDPKRMPMYTLASIATDMTKIKRLTTEEDVLELMDTDVVSLRNDANSVFKALRIELHDPLIEWFNKEYGTNISVGDTLAPEYHGQSQNTMYTIYDIIKSMDDWSLAAFGSLVESTYSVVIALALWHRKISVVNAVRASKAENFAFDEQFGQVEGSTDVKNQYLYVDVAASTSFLHLLDTPPPTLESIKKKKM